MATLCDVNVWTTLAFDPQTVNLFEYIHQQCPEGSKSYDLANIEYIYPKSDDDKTPFMVKFDVYFFAGSVRGKYPVIRTEKQAKRRYSFLFYEYVDKVKGGETFGYDWPTLFVLDPNRYFEMKWLVSQFLANRTE